MSAEKSSKPLDKSTVGITRATGSSAVDRYGFDYDHLSPIIVGQKPWATLFENFFDDFDKFFGDGQVVPCDVIQNKNEKGFITSTEIQYALAGYNKSNVSINVDNDQLYLTVEKTEKSETENKSYIHKGISRRKIEAVYNLSGYDKDNISASFEEGILKLNLPVAAKKEGKKIEIK